MGSHLLLAMNVHFLFADLAMSMKEERAIKPALSAKPDTSASRVSLFPISIMVLVIFYFLLFFEERILKLQLSVRESKS